MKVQLDIQEPNDRAGYLVSDSIEGVVMLNLLASTSITFIALTLEGSVTATLADDHPLMTKGRDYDVHDFHKICQVTKTILPAQDDDETETVIPKGVHRYPFVLCFPSTSTCRYPDGTQHFETPLPPSLEAHSPHGGARTKIKYTIRLDVRRPGRLHRHVSLERKIKLRQNDVAPVIANQAPAASAVLRLDGIKGREWDGQSPVLVLDARLMQARLLVGKPMCLTVMMHRLPTAASDRPVLLKSLLLRLRSTTSITAKARRSSWTNDHDLFKNSDIKGLLGDLQPGSTDLAARLLHNIVIPSDVPPNFNCCSVRQEYVVEIAAGVQIGPGKKLRLLKTSMSVQVSTGPLPDETNILPDYTPASHSHILPSYVTTPRSSRHMEDQWQGIFDLPMRPSSNDVLNAPLPAYSRTG